MLVKEFKNNRWYVTEDSSNPVIGNVGQYGIARPDGVTFEIRNGLLTAVRASNKTAFSTRVEFIDPGVHQWTVPDNVDTILVLAIGGGSNGRVSVVGSSFGTSYAGGGSAISARLSVTPKEIIELEVGTNADGVKLWDGRITTSKTYRTKTANQQGGTARFGDWIVAPGGKTVTSWKTRTACTFTPRNKDDIILNGFTLQGEERVASSIGTETFAYHGTTGFNSNKYYRSLKAVCLNLIETYDPSLPRPEYNDQPLAWLGANATSATSGKPGWAMGGTGYGGDLGYRGGSAYGLFGLGGNGKAGTSTVRASSGGDALNFGGVGGYAGVSANTSSWNASCGSAGPGGIFIWY